MMRDYRSTAAMLALVLTLTAVPNSLGQEFKGKIAKSYAESKEWWPEPVRPHPDAPNILILLLDDRQP